MSSGSLIDVALHSVGAFVGNSAHADNLAVLARLRSRIDIRAARDEIGDELLDAAEPFLLAHRPGAAGRFLAGGCLNAFHLRQQAAVRGHAIEANLACSHADRRHRLRFTPTAARYASSWG